MVNISTVSKHCQHHVTLAQCASDFGLYTTVDCDKIIHRPPVAVSHQQQAPAFDA